MKINRVSYSRGRGQIYEYLGLYVDDFSNFFSVSIMYGGN